MLARRAPRRIDEAPQFIASSLSSAASEWLGAVLFATHATQAKLGRAGARGSSSVRPASQQPKASALEGAPEPQAAAELLLVTRLIHEELGEKTAVVIGAVAALWLGGLTRESVCRAIWLVLLEAFSDSVKMAVYKSRSLDVATAQYSFHLPSIVGVGLTGAGAWCELLVAIRLNCLISA